MGYNKLVISGRTLELYEYQKDIIVGQGSRGLCKEPSNRQNLADSGDVPRQRTIDYAKRKDHARGASLAFRRLILCNLGSGENPLLLTLTYRENITDIRQGYSDFTAFVQSLRYKFGKVFKYVAVPEFQKRGAVHFHALVWGLPSEIFVEERKTRTLAKLWGLGFVFLKKTDGDAKLSSYLSKYMTKAFSDSSLKNCKAYVSSRNMLRPVYISGVDTLWPILDDYRISDAEKQVDSIFDTQWLGRVRYQSFKLPPPCV